MKILLILIKMEVENCDISIYILVSKERIGEKKWRI